MSRIRLPSPAAERRRWTTSSAARFSATKRTLLPSAMRAEIALAIVCDLPVPGGPSMTALALPK
jgi:hypothetical protein